MSPRLPPGPPRSEEALAARAEALAGCTLAEIAGSLAVPVPQDLRRAKGWIGQLLEIALGATATSRALPDFPGLGVEMKTLPVTADGRPRESTYVCTAPLDGSLARSWAASWPRRKLARVLWVPVVGDGAPGERVLGAAVLWSPSADDDEALAADWETLTEPIHLGEHWQIDARRGRFLQLRPKGAHARDWSWARDADGEAVQTMPLGFYLRTRFTRRVLAELL